MCYIQVTRRNLMKHWRKKEKVFAIDQRDLDVTVASNCFVEIEGRVKAAKTASEYNYLSFFIHDRITAQLHCASNRIATVTNFIPLKDNGIKPAVRLINRMKMAELRH